MDAKAIISKGKTQPQEISILNILRSLRANALIIILIAALAAGFGYAINSDVPDSVYQCSYTVFLSYSDEAVLEVEDAPNALVQFNESRVNEALLPIYKISLYSSRVLSKAASSAGIEYDEGKIKGMIDIDSDDETSIATVTVKSDAPDTASTFTKSLADAVSEECAGIIDDFSVSTIEVTAPVTVSEASRPVVKALIYALASAVVCAFVIIVKDIADDPVKSPKELECRTEIIVLSSIPNASKVSRRKSRKE